MNWYLIKLYPAYIKNFMYTFLSTPNPFSFPIQNSLYSATFPLINLSYFPLNLDFCTQQMSSDWHSNISTVSLLTYHWEFLHQQYKSKNLLSRWCSCWMTLWLGLNLTLVLPCLVSSLWKVSIPFTQFGSSLNSLTQMWQNFMASCSTGHQPTTVMETTFLLRHHL